MVYSMSLIDLTQRKLRKRQQSTTHSDFLAHFLSVFERELCKPKRRFSRIWLLKSMIISKRRQVLSGNVDFINGFLRLLNNNLELVTVRVCCLKTLKALYEEQPNQIQCYQEKLKQFSTSFKVIIINLCLNNSPYICMAAVQLITAISKSHQNVYSDEDYAPVYEAMHFRTTCNVPVFVALAKVLGKFLFLRIRQLAHRRIVSGMYSDNIDLLLRIFMEIHMKHKGQASAEFLVDSLVKYGDPIVYEYERMTALLLRESAGFSLTNDEQTAMADIMAHSVKHISTGRVPQDDLSQSQISLSEKRQQWAKICKHKISSFYIARFPNILAKFRCDARILGVLLLVPQQFDGQMFCHHGNEVILVNLLTEIGTIIQMHSEDVVLEECAATYNSLCKEKYSTYSRCKILLDALISDLKRKCMEAFCGSSDDNVLMACQQNKLLSALKRLAAFSRYFFSYNQEIFDTMIDYIRRDKIADEACIKYSYLTCLKMLPWALRKTLEDPSSDEAISALRQRFFNFVDIGLGLFSKGSNGLKREAFKGLCLILSCFCPLESNERLKYLVFKPTEKVIMNLLKFIQEHVFVEELKGDWQERWLDVADRRTYLHVFCMFLLRSNTMYPSVVSNIFRNYRKFNNYYDDIVNGVCCLLLKRNIKCFIEITCHCLQSDFLKLYAASNGVVKTTETAKAAFKELNNFARWFCKVLSTNVTAEQTQWQSEAIIHLHTKGIEFSMIPFTNALEAKDPPPHTDYLDILVVFVKLLTPQGCKHMYKVLGKRFPLPENWVWKPFQKYRVALVKGFTAYSSATLQNRLHGDTANVSSTDDEDEYSNDDDEYSNDDHDEDEYDNGK